MVLTSPVMGSESHSEVIAAAGGHRSWMDGKPERGVREIREGDNKVWMRLGEVGRGRPKVMSQRPGIWPWKDPPEIIRSASTALSDRNNEAQGGSGLHGSHTANQRHNRLSNPGPMAPNTEHCFRS